MIRAEDNQDPFWNVKAREQAEEDKLRRDILEISVQIDTARRVEALRGAAGFQEFVKSVQASHALAREKLIGDEKLTDQGLREQRGRVKGLESVLALLTKPQITSTLAEQLAERQNVLADMLRRRPKPKPEPEKVTP
jgi:hypothetical protein